MEHFTFFCLHSKLRVIIQNMFKTHLFSSVDLVFTAYFYFMICVTLYNMADVYIFCFDVNIYAVISMKWRFIKALSMYV